MTKFSLLTPVPPVLHVHDAFPEAALQQTPIKTEVVFLNSHFPAAFSVLQLRQDQRENPAAMLSGCANQECYPGWLGFFLQGQGIEKQCGLSGISGVFVP